MRAVGYLVRNGYRDIVVASHREWEERSGYQHEHEATTMVARASSGAIQRLEYTWTSYKGGEHLALIGALSESELATLVAERGIADDPEFRSALQAADHQHAEQERKRSAAQLKFEPLRPSCPICSSRMVLRSSREGSAVPRFWGCPGFLRDRCRGTRNIVADEWHVLASLVRDGAS